MGTQSHWQDPVSIRLASYSCLPKPCPDANVEASQRLKLIIALYTLLTKGLGYKTSYLLYTSSFVVLFITPAQQLKMIDIYQLTVLQVISIDIEYLNSSFPVSQCQDQGVCRMCLHLVVRVLFQANSQVRELAAYNRRTEDPLSLLVINQSLSQLGKATFSLLSMFLFIFKARNGDSFLR